MTAESLGHHGQIVNLNDMDLKDLPIGSKAYVYKPPTQQETISRGRKAKHIDHYIGPGTISRHLGTRSACSHDNKGQERERKRISTRRRRGTSLETKTGSTGPSVS
jgi:hypothetical protein